MSLQPLGALVPVVLIAVLTVGSNLITEGVALASATGGDAP
jgi:hypothetical protein